MEAETLVNTMHLSLAEVKVQTRVDTLRDVEATTSANTLAYRVAEVKANKVDKTLTDVKGVSPG